MSVIDISRGVSLSLRQLADETGFHRDTIARHIKDEGLKSSGKRGGHNVYLLRNVLKLIYQTGENGFDPDKLDPYRRKAHYQSEHEKLKLEVERRELIPRIEVEQVCAALIKVMVETLDVIPDSLERDAGLTPAVLTKIEASLDRTREELYKRWSEEEEDVGSAADECG